MNVREDWQRGGQGIKKKKGKERKIEVGREGGGYIIIRSFDRDYRRGINE